MCPHAPDPTTLELHGVPANTYNYQYSGSGVPQCGCAGGEGTDPDTSSATAGAGKPSLTTSTDLRTLVNISQACDDVFYDLSSALTGDPPSVAGPIYKVHLKPMNGVLVPKTGPYAGRPWNYHVVGFTAIAGEPYVLDPMLSPTPIPWGEYREPEGNKYWQTGFAPNWEYAPDTFDAMSGTFNYTNVQQ